MSSVPPADPAQHYFTVTPGAPVKHRYVEFTVAGRALKLRGSSGVFSADRLDPGTAVLLRKAPLPTARGEYLDLGTGYGPIACALAVSAADAAVYAVDVNTRALDLARHNADQLDLGDRIVTARPDDLPEDQMFDQIWSNPPIRIGKAALHELLDRWLPRLRPDGVAWLVVARHLGGDSLQHWLADKGWQVDRHASQKGYRVLAVRH
ncbi:MAG: methyltransferase [Micromonosporaceae bacterium]|nr:methyltransferase [Micromonosporaceae bacterium]